MRPIFGLLVLLQDFHQKISSSQVKKDHWSFLEMYFFSLRLKTLVFLRLAFFLNNTQVHTVKLGAKLKPRWNLWVFIVHTWVIYLCLCYQIFLLTSILRLRSWFWWNWFLRKPRMMTSTSSEIRLRVEKDDFCSLNSSNLS